MPVTKTIAKNIVFNYFGIVGLMVIAFFLSPFLVHTLGDSRYGIWTIISAFSGYMSLLDFGVASALTRYVARHYKRGELAEINVYVNSAIFLLVLFSIIIIFLSTVLSDLIVAYISLEPELRDTLRVLIIIISFDVSLFVIAGVFRGVFGGFQRFELINIARLSTALFKAVIWYLVLTDGFGLIAMAYVSIAANAFILAFYFYALKRLYGFTSISHKLVKKDCIARIFNFGKFVFVSMVSNQIMNYSGPFIVGIYLGASTVTYYAIPWTLSEHVKRLCLAVSRTYIPAFSEIDAEQDMGRLYRSYLDGTRVMLIVSSLFCAGMLSMGSAFIAIWIGEQYAIVAQSLIAILFVTFYFYATHLIDYSLLQGLANNKRYAQTTIFISIIGIALSIYLVRDYGLVGVVLGTAIPQIVFYGLAVPFYVVKIVFKKSILEYFARTHLRTLGPAIGLFLLLEIVQLKWAPISYTLLFSEAIACTGLYFVMIFLVTLNKKEKANILLYFSRKIKKS